MRPLALAGLALVSALGYRAFWPLVPPGGGRPAPFGVVLLLLTLLLPYGAACWLALAAPAPRRAGWRWAEWAVILGGALLFRAILLPLPPLLSPDAYRYVWDARLTSHGLSPYLHGPSWPGFAWLRDSALYPRVPWKNVPTIYPPGAQLLYRLAYLIAPSNVWGIKVEMTAFDLLAGAALMLFLRRRGQDPRRAIVYLWAPLVVVEFALSGHEDSAAIAFILLALLANGAAFRGSRVVVGVLLGAATLVKLYPLVLVVALARRRDWPLLGALTLTVAAGYAPYWRDGLADLGFLATYLTQVEVSYGGALLLIRSMGFALGLSARAVQAIGAMGALVGLGAIVWLRAGLTPRPPSLAGKGESGSPRPAGEGLGEEVSGLAAGRPGCARSRRRAARPRWRHGRCDRALAGLLAARLSVVPYGPLPLLRALPGVPSPTAGGGALPGRLGLLLLDPARLRRLRRAGARLALSRSVRREPGAGAGRPRLAASLARPGT